MGDKLTLQTRKGAEAILGANLVNGEWLMKALSPRETEVARMMAAGKSDVEIADHLGNRPGTVCQQRKTIYAKIGVSSRAAAVEKLRKVGVVE